MHTALDQIAQTLRNQAISQRHTGLLVCDMRRSTSLRDTAAAVTAAETIAVQTTAPSAVAMTACHLLPSAITAGTTNSWSYSPKFGKATHFQHSKVSI